FDGNLCSVLGGNQQLRIILCVEEAISKQKEKDCLLCYLTGRKNAYSLCHSDGINVFLQRTKYGKNVSHYAQAKDCQ
ncbi:MAG: hypothetical protein Q4B16_08440, partial [Bacteroidia bacterium]|nr:hypothetical protein [Bacteroidia bacterium]